MEYTQITSLVPAGEHFDATAVGEGIYLTTSHVNAIESTLASNATKVAELSAAETASKEKVAAMEGTITAHEATIAANKTTAEEQAAKIVALEAQIVTLGKKSSGTGTILTKVGAAEVEGEGETPSYASENNPANQFADKALSRKPLESYK